MAEVDSVSGEAGNYDVRIRIRPRNVNENCTACGAGAVIWASGWNPYDAARIQSYGYDRYDNVITSLELGHMLDHSGPTGGRILRPSDDRGARNIAFIQCAGSREQNYIRHCSRICCTASLKQSIYITEKYVAESDARATIYYIDIRTIDRLEDFQKRVQEDEKVRFIKSKVANITEDRASGDVILNGVNTGGYHRYDNKHDMAVLTIGMEPGVPAQAVGNGGVMLMGCKNGDDCQCHFVKRSEIAHYRMSKINDSLQQLQLETERVETYKIEITDTDRVVELIEGYSQKDRRNRHEPVQGFLISPHSGTHDERYQHRQNQQVPKQLPAGSGGQPRGRGTGQEVHAVRRVLRLGLAPKNNPTLCFAGIFWDNISKNGRVNEASLSLKLYFMDGFFAGVKKSLVMKNTGLGVLRTRRLDPFALVRPKGVMNPKQFQSMLRKAREIESLRNGYTA